MKIDFEPVGRRGECPAGLSLLEAAQRVGVDLVSLCGGRGTCHRCKVQVLGGSVSPPTENEKSYFSSQELESGYRLACQTYPLGDCKLGVPTDSLTAPQRAQVEGWEVAVSPEPTVRAYRLELTPPSINDLRADARRLLEALYRQHRVRCFTIDLEALRILSPQLRSGRWQAQASVRGDEVIAISSWHSRQLGLAVDIGTTKIAGYLIDPDSGKTLAAHGIMNPQISFGEDVISRIARVRESPTAGAKMQVAVVKALNQIMVDLCAEVRAEPEEIFEVVVVGNTAMHHLLLRLPVEQLALSPFIPAVCDSLDIKARELGIHANPGAYVHLLPNIAGFVGADHIAMLLATGVWQSGGVRLALDIGTNTEVAMISGGEIASVSCASGPAFEGAHIKNGMRAAPGAIERLRLVDNEVEYQTIGGAPPAGICGSGILDAVAQLHLAGVLDRGGRMGDHPRVRGVKGKREFVLVSEDEIEEREGQDGQGGRPAITITQRDVREVQLAKGAIKTGIQVLLDSMGHTAEEIEQVVIAGAFGSYIDVDSAIAIGMLPPLPRSRFRQVGNAAGMGAKMALISRQKRTEAQRIADRVHYLELTNTASFTKTFVDATYLGHQGSR